MGLVFVGFIPVLQREARFTPRQLTTLAGRAAARRGVRARLDAVPRPDADRGDRGRVGAPTARASPAASLLVIAYCLGLGIPFVLLAFGSARAVQGLGWLRRHTRAHPDLRRGRC